MPLPGPLGARFAAILPNVWLMTYKSKLANIHWTFRPTDPTVYKQRIHPCLGQFQLTATRFRQSLVVKIQADLQSFTDLICPTSTGFTKESKHSFVAKAHVAAYQYQFWPRSNLGWQLIDSQSIPNVALEFGGDYRC